MIEERHNINCELARPDTPCKCACNGKRHAKLTAKHLTEWFKMDKQMTKDMGGEVEEFVDKYEGRIIRCFGTCREERVMSNFVGYDHDGGLADKDGKRWWVYFECPECKYGHSFAKMEFFEQHTEVERKAELEK